jgi:hypothetical protein
VYYYNSKTSVLDIMAGSTKTLIHVPAEYVDAANDAVKWVVALLVSGLWNQFAIKSLGLRQDSVTMFGFGSHRQSVIGGVVLALGFLVYQLLVARFVMFVPMPGQATYYISLKRS